MTDHTATDTPQAAPAIGARLEPVVGRLVPKRDEAAEHALLERAAFAAGLVVESWIAWGGAWVYPREAPANEDGEFPIFKWVPLDDDGDALRLALLLRISVWRDDDLMRVGTLWQEFTPGEDVAAIARRLIVRAAAMCGKTPNGPVEAGPTVLRWASPRTGG
jgi:hypothetical protein